MIDVKDLLENETIKGLLKKFGVSPDQAEGVAKQALSAITSKFGKDPKAMSSLLSENDNTDDDNKVAEEVENDFIDRLVKKTGIPEGVASQAKGALPGILSQVTSKLSSDGNNSEEGIAGMIGNFTDLFDGDDDDKDGKDSGGGIGGMIGKLFG